MVPLHRHEKGPKSWGCPIKTFFVSRVNTTWGLKSRQSFPQCHVVYTHLVTQNLVTVTTEYDACGDKYRLSVFHFVSISQTFVGKISFVSERPLPASLARGRRLLLVCALRRRSFDGVYDFSSHGEWRKEQKTMETTKTETSSAESDSGESLEKTLRVTASGIAIAVVRSSSFVDLIRCVQFDNGNLEETSFLT